MTTSASATAWSMVECDENSVVMVVPKRRSSRSSTANDRSRTVTRAPMPTAMRVAFSPTTPPPRTTTLAGGTPGTPLSSTPGPPLGASRAAAANWTDRRPAICDMGASSGSVPAGPVTVSYAIAVTPLAHSSAVCCGSGARWR